MPKTFEDLSFAERNAIQAAGYDPWKNAQAYRPVKIEDDEARYQRETRETQAKQTTMEAQAKFEKAKSDAEKARNPCDWCKKNAIKCFADYNNSIVALNATLQNAACANNEPSVLLWEVRDSIECGYAPPTQTKTQPLSLEICNRTEPDTQKSEKDANYCAWCIKLENQAECTKERTAMNESFVQSACAANPRQQKAPQYNINPGACTNTPTQSIDITNAICSSVKSNSNNNNNASEEIEEITWG
jgi:hypothetical protein